MLPFSQFEHKAMENMTRELKQHLEAMYRIRFFEEKVTELRKAQKIVGSVHLCNGQEAIYVGARAALTPSDNVFSTYRGHGWALACGVPPRNMFAELLGRETGVCRGRGGSAQLSSADHGFYGENSIVGAGAAIALGAALSAQIERRGRVALTAFGEGAMNQGGVHEAMNFAAYKSLPIVFICENNKYSELTPTSEMVRTKDLYRRADGYGFSSLCVDGNDPVAVYDAVKEMVDRARGGGGPGLVEARTQRLVGHYYGDMQSYRPKGEIAEAMKVEPIVVAVARLVAHGMLAQEIKELEAQVRAEIQTAADLALADPMTSESTVMEHLYA
jgi:TPP-dependent pyruvate/acetoin dehydrogenase alpha subunit